MDKQNNPVTRQLEKMYELWDTTIDQNTQLVRWVLPREDKRMYEVFCHGESIHQWKLKDVTILLSSPFNDVKSFSADLVKELTASVETQQKILLKKGTLKQWGELKSFKIQAEENVNKNLLQETLLSFRKAMGYKKDKWLNIALLPEMIFNSNQYIKWLITVFKQGFPGQCRLIVLDYQADENLKRAVLEYPGLSKSLHFTPGLLNCMQQIATDGMENDPEAAFRNCLFEMGKAVKEKDNKTVSYWGEKGLEIAQKSQIMSLLGSAYVAYTGMLMSFKGNRFKAEEILNDGLEKIKPTADNGDVNCQYIVLHIKALLSAVYIKHSMKHDAIEWVLRQARYAKEKGFIIQAVGAYRLAAQYAKRTNKHAYLDSLQQAWEIGKGLSETDKEYSKFRFVAYDWYQALRMKRKFEEADEIHKTMEAIWGKNWQELIEEQMQTTKETREAIS